MTIINHFLSFVPPTLLFIAPLFSNEPGSSELLFFAPDKAPLVESVTLSLDTLDLNVFAEQNPVPCNADLTDVMVQAFGGQAPYSVQWSNLTAGTTGTVQIPDFEGGAVIPGMQAGQFLFNITDALNESQETAFSLAEPQLLTIKLLAFDASCNGSYDGVAMVDEAHGGTVATDYQYYWETNAGVSSASAGFLNPGTYWVTVVDDNGCFMIDNVTVGSFAVIFPNPHTTQISCNGAGDGVIDLYPVSPNSPYTYQWSNNVTTGDLSSAWQLSPGAYSVTITDGTGVCTETATFNMTEPPRMEVDYKITEPLCFGEKGILEVVGVANNIGDWTPSVVGNAEKISDSMFEFEAGSQQQLVITDGKGCEISDHFLAPAPHELFIELGDNYAIKYGEEINFDPDVFPIQGITFQWSPADYLSCTDCPNPVARPLAEVAYRLLMTDAVGCSVEDYVSVAVRKSRDIYIPNAFSPNQDGVNDRFCAFGGPEIVQVQTMHVFDRWGGILFEEKTGFSITEQKCGWDGTARGKQLGNGVYLYTMNVEFVDGEVLLYAGEVQLMR